MSDELAGHLKLSDFRSMLMTSAEIASRNLGSDDNIILVIEDGDGDVYAISDVKYDDETGAIHLKFNYDDEVYEPDDSFPEEEEAW
jgi:hypothetical protein